MPLCPWTARNIVCIHKEEVDKIKRRQGTPMYEICVKCAIFNTKEVELEDNN